MTEKRNRPSRLSPEDHRALHRPSQQTLKIQADSQSGCQYCQLIDTGSGPLADWFVKLGETDTSIAWLHRDQLWPGRCVVAFKEHVTELFHIEPEVCQTHMREMIALSQAIQQAFKPNKMNYECLGNASMAEHVHWHLIPRYEWDLLWRRTVWEEPHEPHFLDENEYRGRIEQILEHLTWF